MTTLPPLLKGPPHDRDAYVCEHSIPFSPKHWLDRLPDRAMWPPLLAAKEPVGKWPRVSRRDVFDLASNDNLSTPIDGVHLYVAACAWGVGTQARLVGRRVRVLRDNPDPGTRLLGAIGVLRHTGPAAAYASFQPGGANRLIGLGPGFHTKILYFAGWDRTPGCQQPLILDQYVAAALNDQADLGWSTRWKWTADQYEHYLDLVAGWADAWGASADVVERTLFDHGRTLPG